MRETLNLLDAFGLPETVTILPLYAASQERGYDGQAQAPAFVPFVSGWSVALGKVFLKQGRSHQTWRCVQGQILTFTDNLLGNLCPLFVC